MMLSIRFKKTIAVFAVGYLSVSAVSVQAAPHFHKTPNWYLAQERMQKEREARYKYNLAQQQAQQKSAAEKQQQQAIGEQMRKQLAEEKARKAAQKAAQVKPKPKPSSDVPFAMSCNAPDSTAYFEGMRTNYGGRTYVSLMKYKIVPKKPGSTVGEVKLYLKITQAPNRTPESGLAAVGSLLVNNKWNNFLTGGSGTYTTPEIFMSVKGGGRNVDYTCSVKKRV